MDESTHERAIKLEGLLPKALRSLFKPEASDPLVELPVGQMRLMRLLAMRPWTPSHLGEELGLSVSAVTQMANRLEGIGYVARVEDPIDRRVKHLSLTTLGKTLMSNRQQRRVGTLQTVLAHMPEERQKEFVALLEEVIEATTKAAASADNSIFMEAEMEQKLPMPPAFVMEER